jgi:hypothetical protein
VIISQNLFHQEKLLFILADFDIEWFLIYSSISSKSNLLFNFKKYFFSIKLFLSFVIKLLISDIGKNKISSHKKLVIFCGSFS